MTTTTALTDTGDITVSTPHARAELLRALGHARRGRRSSRLITVAAGDGCRAVASLRRDPYARYGYRLETVPCPSELAGAQAAFVAAAAHYGIGDTLAVADDGSEEAVRGIREADTYELALAEALHALGLGVPQDIVADALDLSGWATRTGLTINIVLGEWWRTAPSL